jgi:hypothetical protein
MTEKFIKEIKLDKVPMPFIPHLNKSEMLNSVVKHIPYKYSKVILFMILKLAVLKLMRNSVKRVN